MSVARQNELPRYTGGSVQFCVILLACMSMHGKTQVWRSMNFSRKCEHFIHMAHTINK